MIMKSLVLSLFVSLFAVAFLVAQPQDNNFQKYYSKVQTVLAKQAEELSTSDVRTLEDAIRLSGDAFGAANQKLVGKMIQDARSKKNEYDNYIKTKANLALTETKLGKTQEALKTETARGDSLYSENVQLKVLIEQLNTKINKMDKEAKKLQNINKKIQQENMQTKEMLTASRSSINRIMRLLANSPERNELAGDIPASLQDSLNQSECQIAELLKNNYIITLDGLKRDQMFIDSASTYFKENLAHLPIIDEYIIQGMDLVARLKERGSDCTNSYASEIETAMTEFKANIENTETSFGEKIAKFFSENLGIIIPLSLILLVIIVFLFIRKKK